MRYLLVLLLWRPLPATLIPGPNLAQRIESAGAIVTGKLVHGTTLASGDQVSSDFVLRVDRVLKGNLLVGTEIPAHLEGRGIFNEPASKPRAIPPMFGIWFLSTGPQPYGVISRDGAVGEIYFAPVILPEEAPPGKPGTTPAASVANEMISALQWLAAQPKDQGQFPTLAEDFRTLAPADTLPAYRQFVREDSPRLRAFGIAGLIAAGEPEGVIQAADQWNDLAAAADLSFIIVSLMSYANEDPAGTSAVASLALREGAAAGLRENAVYALRAIHTREALPALVALLDDPSERVQPYALSGLCLFVRNGPPVTPQSVPSLSWMQSRQPAPLLTHETERYCSLGGKIANPEAYASFWKSWWNQHRAGIEGR
jgi:hypothetical protein